MLVGSTGPFCSLLPSTGFVLHFTTEFKTSGRTGSIEMIDWNWLFATLAGPQQILHVHHAHTQKSVAAGNLRKTCQKIRHRVCAFNIKFQTAVYYRRISYAAPPQMRHPSNPVYLNIVHGMIDCKLFMGQFACGTRFLCQALSWHGHVPCTHKHNTDMRYARKIGFSHRHAPSLFSLLSCLCASVHLHHLLLLRWRFFLKRKTLSCRRAAAFVLKSQRFTRNGDEHEFRIHKSVSDPCGQRAHAFWNCFVQP